MSLFSNLARGFAVAVFATQAAGAAVFSYDVATTAADPASLYAYGRAVDSSAASLGLAAGDDITSATSGVLGNIIWFFSVDRASTGLTGTAVADHGAAGRGASVFYQGPFCVVNCLAASYTGLGMTASDEVDAMMGSAFGFGGRDFFFTLGRTSPTLAALGATAADILFHAADGALSVALSGTALGLGAGDAIDALEIDLPGPLLPGPFSFPAGTTYYWSLDRASPGLGSTYSPADVFRYRLGEGLSVTTAGSLGLNATDNIDALASNFIDCWPNPAVCVPEPASLALFGVALGGIGWVRRRKPG